MNNSLKFRVYCKVAHYYVKVKELKFDEDGNINYMKFYKPKSVDPDQFVYVCPKSDIKEFIFEVYTGLKDEKGNLIFEGDILKGTYYIENPVIDYYPVERCEDMWINGNEGFPLSGYNDLSEVVGNIHDNSDLLEDK